MNLKRIILAAAIGLHLASGAAAQTVYSTPYIGDRVIYVDTVADMLALPAGKSLNGQVVITKRYSTSHTVGDGSGNAYRSDTSESGTPDGGFIINDTGTHWHAVDKSVANVMQFGALGDDSTDNIDEIQAAVDAVAAAGGGKVLFPAGVFKISTTVDVLGSNIVIELAEGATLKAAPTFTEVSTDGMLTLGDNATVYSSITVQGHGTIDGDDDALKLIQGRGPITDILIRDIEATGSASTAINIEGASAGSPAIRVTIDGVYCHDCNEGIQIFKATDGKIQNCRVEDMTGSDCIEFSQVVRGQVLNNQCLNPYNSNSGIDIFEASYDILVANNIVRQTSAATGTSGIVINGSTYPTEVELHDNCVFGNFSTGIALGSANGVIVTGGYIHDIAGATAAYGISGSGTDVQISNVSISDTNAYSIQCTGGRWSITDCTLKNACLANAHTSNINLSGGDDHLIARCRFINDTGDPKHWYNISNAAGVVTRVLDNWMDGNRKAGGRPIQNQNDSDLTARFNEGFVSENKGTATVANGTTSIAVSHGLNRTPTADQIVITPTNSLGSATKFSVGSITTTQFTITVDSDPGATTATFAWRIVPMD